MTLNVSFKTGLRSKAELKEPSSPIFKNKMEKIQEKQRESIEIHATKEDS